MPDSNPTSAANGSLEVDTTVKPQMISGDAVRAGLTAPISVDSVNVLGAPSGSVGATHATNSALTHAEGSCVSCATGPHAQSPSSSQYVGTTAGPGRSTAPPLEPRATIEEVPYVSGNGDRAATSAEVERFEDQIVSSRVPAAAADRVGLQLNYESRIVDGASRPLLLPLHRDRARTAQRVGLQQRGGLFLMGGTLSDAWKSDQAAEQAEREAIERLGKPKTSIYEFLMQRINQGTQSDWSWIHDDGWGSLTSWEYDVLGSQSLAWSIDDMYDYPHHNHYRNLIRLGLARWESKIEGYWHPTGPWAWSQPGRDGWPWGSGPYPDPDFKPEIPVDSFFHPQFPSCPCDSPDGPRGETPQIDDGWGREGPGLHEGATLCYRSYNNPGRAGQQCCYDGRGKLITSGSAAGTPDLVGACDGESPDGVAIVALNLVGDHYIEDVKPFLAMNKDWREYQKRWPPNNSRGCPGNEVTR